MTPETMRRPVSPPTRQERVGGAGWTAAWLTGAAALASEGALAVIVYVLAGLRNEHYVASGFAAYAGYLLAAVVTAAVLGVAGAIGSAAAVLPVVRLSRWSARRAGRAETTRRCLAACAALAAAVAGCAGVPAALLGGGWAVPPLLLLAAFAALVPAVLCARAVTVLRCTGTRFGLAGAVLLGGGTLSAVVLAGGLGAYATGLIQDYEPPRLTDAQLVGTWTDDDGGSLTLRADGTAVADYLAVHTGETADGGDDPDRCDGAGTWARDPSPSGAPQLELDAGGCLEGRAWHVGGTEEHPTLYHWIGDPDSLDRYVLHRR